MVSINSREPIKHSSFSYNQQRGGYLGYNLDTAWKDDSDFDIDDAVDPKKQTNQPDSGTYPNADFVYDIQPDIEGSDSIDFDFYDDNLTGNDDGSYAASPIGHQVPSNPKSGGGAHGAGGGVVPGSSPGWSSPPAPLWQLAVIQDIENGWDQLDEIDPMNHDIDSGLRLKHMKEIKLFIREIVGEVLLEKTFKQARGEILQYLRDVEGWSVEYNLAIPHATSPYEDVRLWFKPQAVYMDEGYRGRFSYKDARSIWIPDLRKVTPQEFLAYVERWMEK